MENGFRELLMAVFDEFGLRNDFLTGIGGLLAGFGQGRNIVCYGFPVAFQHFPVGSCWNSDLGSHDCPGASSGNRDCELVPRFQSKRPFVSKADGNDGFLQPGCQIHRAQRHFPPGAGRTVRRNSQRMSFHFLPTGTDRGCTAPGGGSPDRIKSNQLTGIDQPIRVPMLADKKRYVGIPPDHGRQQNVFVPKNEDAGFIKFAASGINRDVVMGNFQIERLRPNPCCQKQTDRPESAGLCFHESNHRFPVPNPVFQLVIPIPVQKSGRPGLFPIPPNPVANSRPTIVRFRTQTPH